MGTPKKASQSAQNAAPLTPPPRPLETTDPKRPCRVTVTAPGWHGARTAAIAAGCSSVSDMIERLGRGELAIITSDAAQFDPITTPANSPVSANQPFPSAPSQTSTGSPTVIPQHVHYHNSQPTTAEGDIEEKDAGEDTLSLPKVIATALCAVIILGSLSYIADRVVTITTNVFTDSSARDDTDNIVTPATGDIVAGYRVSDEFGIRPFHPVTGAPNVPHNGVDLAMDIGTPIYAVGDRGDAVEVDCWWDVDGGGWVVNQTADSYPGYVFQSLHMSENGCKEGKAKAGDAIAYSGNSGLGTGAHYDFRVKINGAYVPPPTKYLESAVTGEPPKGS